MIRAHEDVVDDAPILHATSHGGLNESMFWDWFEKNRDRVVFTIKFKVLFFSVSEDITLGELRFIFNKLLSWV